MRQFRPQSDSSIYGRMAREWWYEDANRTQSDSDNSVSKRRRERRCFAEGTTERSQAVLDSQAQIWARLCNIESTVSMVSGSIHAISFAKEQVKYNEVHRIVHVDVPKIQFGSSLV